MTLGCTRIEVEVEGPGQTSQSATANGRSKWKTPDGLNLNLILILILATDLNPAQTLKLQQDCPRTKPEAENCILLCRNYKVNV